VQHSRRDDWPADVVAAVDQDGWNTIELGNAFSNSRGTGEEAQTLGTVGASA